MTFWTTWATETWLVEDEIEQCLSAAHAGEDSIFIDSGDFTDEELLHIQEELQRRLENE